MKDCGPTPAPEQRNNERNNTWTFGIALVGSVGRSRRHLLLQGPLPALPDGDVTRRRWEVTGGATLPPKQGCRPPCDNDSPRMCPTGTPRHMMQGQAPATPMVQATCPHKTEWAHCQSSLGNGSAQRPQGSHTIRSQHWAHTMRLHGVSGSKQGIRSPAQASPGQLHNTPQCASLRPRERTPSANSGCVLPYRTHPLSRV